MSDKPAGRAGNDSRGSKSSNRGSSNRSKNTGKKGGAKTSGYNDSSQHSANKGGSRGSYNKGAKSTKSHSDYKKRNDKSFGDDHKFDDHKRDAGRKSDNRKNDTYHDEHKRTKIKDDNYSSRGGAKIYTSKDSLVKEREQKSRREAEKRQEQERKAQQRRAEFEDDSKRKGTFGNGRKELTPKKRDGGKRKQDRLTPSRRLALKTVIAVREREAFVQQVSASTIRKARGSQEDKAFAELLAQGVVSTVGTLDYIIDRSLNSPDDIEPEVRDALRISAYEMAFLEKEDHAVVDQGVEMVRFVAPRAAGLGNAVLHRMLADTRMFPWGDPNKDDEALAYKLGFPLWLTKKLIADLGRREAVVFMVSCNQPAPVYIAANSILATPQEVFDELQQLGAEPQFLGPENRGCIATGKARLAVRSEMLRDGRALVSDASAQIAALLATPIKGKRFLEVGSGRGTKTVLLQSNANKFNGQQAVMSCVDLHAFKKGVLEKRVQESHLQGITAYEGDATNLDSIEGLPQSFGKALIDAPCSGLGTLRRHPEIRWTVTPEKINTLADIGLNMLKSVALRIEPGGTIMFSTCTVTHEENQDVIQAFLASDEGKDFSLKKVGERDYVFNQLVPGGPDVHFVAQLVRAGELSSEMITLDDVDSTPVFYANDNLDIFSEHGLGEDDELDEEELTNKVQKASQDFDFLNGSLDSLFSDDVI